MSKAKTLFYTSDTEGLDEVAEALLNEEVDITNGEGNSSVEGLTDFWRINNVPYRNDLYRVDLAKAVLDGGNSKTQDEWVEYSKQAQQQDGFCVGDFPLYCALFSQLHDLRENPSMKNAVEEAKAFVKQQMFDRWLMTLTRLKYKSNGDDTIVHNYGMPEQYELNGNVVGNDGWITSVDTDAQNMLGLLTGQNDVAEVNEVYKWLTGKDTYLWRLNSKQDTERVARFRADSGWAGLDCYGNPQYSNSSLGVRAAKIKV